MEGLTHFIRNDDVGALTPALEQFVETFLAAGLPVSYQIIPTMLTPECARWLAGLRAAHPQLIEFGQHGLRHEMLVRGKRVWREFGPERSYADQLADISMGKAMLEDRLGPIHLFTPPQHKYDRNTLRACAKVGHTHFSAAHYPALPYRAAYALGSKLGMSSIRHHGFSQHGGQRDDAALIECSISVAMDNGGSITTRPTQIAAKAAHAARHTDAVGFMLHHHVYQDNLTLLRHTAKALQVLGVERFATLTALADDVSVARRARPAPPPLLPAALQ